MNVNFGLFAPLAEKLRGKKERNLAYAERALSRLETILNILKEN